MRKGKIAVQVAHGEVYFIEDIQTAIFEGDSIANYGNYQKWRYEDNELMMKIVLKATEKEMSAFAWDLKGKKIWAHPVYDKGLTQVEPDSFTCLVIEPLPEEQCNELFGHLRLV